MKTKELPIGTAILVEPKALYELKDGDECLVGIVCDYVNGKFYPRCKRMALVPDLLDDAENDNLIILKREKNVTPT